MQKELPHRAIKHVVVLMLENRGFDHMMGWLYAPDERPQIIGHDQRPFRGLSTLLPEDLGRFANPAPDGEPMPINRGARSPRVPSHNTGETYPHIMNQMWGGMVPPEVWQNPQARRDAMYDLTRLGQPRMNGFVLDYFEEVLHGKLEKRLSRDELNEVMDTYLPCQMPVLSGLARFYAASDAWYGSVPSQTNTNRAFSMAGTSRGMVNNSFYEPVTYNPGMGGMRLVEGATYSDALPVSTRSLFEVLQEADFSWRYYFQDWWPPRDVAGTKWQYARTLIPFLGNPQFNDNFVMFDASNPDNELFRNIQNDDLPAVTWIEPKWGGGRSWFPANRQVGNDYHPACDTTTGEDFVMDVYNALSSNPEVWRKTLLIVTFDENGGTFDHLYPPTATASFLDRCPLVAPTGPEPMDPVTRTQYGFDFTLLGVRVPTLLISPWVPEATIFRSPNVTPFDHTSIPATILTLAGTERRAWGLGERTAAAPTFEGLIQGQMREIPNPSIALRAPDDPPAAPAAAPPISSVVPYVLQYLGSPWGPVDPPPAYLGNADVSRSHCYATLTDNLQQAARFLIVPGQRTGAMEDVMNMSYVGIRTMEALPDERVWMAVSHREPSVFFSKGEPRRGDHGEPPDGGRERNGLYWQIRILNSRDPRQQVTTGDRVYFVSQLPPLSVQNIYGRFTPDPLQRLVADLEDGRYLTTRAGEWGLWRLLPVQ